MTIEIQHHQISIPVQVRKNDDQLNITDKTFFVSDSSGTIDAYKPYSALLSDLKKITSLRSKRTENYDRTSKICNDILSEIKNKKTTVAEAFLESPKSVTLSDLLATSKISEKLDKPHEKRAIESIQEKVLTITNTIGDKESSTSLKSIYESLVLAVDKADRVELTKFHSGLDKYKALYKNITNIFSEFTKLIRADGDNKMRVDFVTLQNRLQALLTPYQNPPSIDSIIAGRSPSNGLTQAEANDVCVKLGLGISSCVQKNTNDGTYYVIPDLSQVNKMIESIPTGATNDYAMTIPSYNVWKSGFDAQMSRLEEVVQASAQKYSNAYSRFESTNKTISSIMQSFADLLHVFLRNLI